MTYKYISNLILIVIISLIASGCLEENSSINKSDLPQGFPQDFPFESSLKHIHIQNQTNFEQEGFYHLSFESEKSHEKLYKWYKNTINDRWQITGYMLTDKNGKFIDKSKKTPEVGPILGMFFGEAAKDSNFNKEHGIITIQIGEIPMEKKHQYGIGLLYFKNEGEKATMDVYLAYFPDLSKP